MKKFLLLIGLCSAPSFLFAQDFGKTLVTGSMSFSTDKRSPSSGYFGEQTRRTFSIQPQVGFFVSPAIAVGVSAGYAHEFSSQSSNSYYNGTMYNVPSKLRGNHFNVGPFARIYTSVSPKIAFFGHAGAYYQTGKYVTERDFSNLPADPTSPGIRQSLSLPKKAEDLTFSQVSYFSHPISLE
jgi:hypothetical protein